MKKVLFWIWLAVCILGVFLVSGLITADQNYTGTEVALTTSESKLITISAGEITIEAASANFFALRNGSETVVGVLTQKPLGWGSDLYFRAGPVEISDSSTWVVEKGTNVTIQLNSPETMTVQESLKTVDKAGSTFAIVMMGVLIWLVVLLLFSV